MPIKADIGIFSGSGIYQLEAEKKDSLKISTPFGSPSDMIDILNISGKNVAFLPRHGKNHSIPPHNINYRANLWAMKELGVKRLISPCACGSLKKEIAPGDFVITDQFVDRTKGRADTFSEGGKIMHISSADPYCPKLRKLAAEAVSKNGCKLHDTGTMVVINGPRFSTKAESKWFADMGWHTVNMTQYPEVVLAQELGICFVNIAMVTDYDAGLEGSVEPVSAQEVFNTFGKTVSHMHKILKKLVELIPSEVSNCRCQQKVQEAYFS